LALKTTPEIALNILDGVIDFMNFRHKDKIQSFQRIIFAGQELPKVA
jgi:hypothetical protein